MFSVVVTVGQHSFLVGWGLVLRWAVVGCVGVLVAAVAVFAVRGGK